MTASLLPARDIATGASFGFVVGALAGVTLTGSTVTAEVGLVLWLIAVLAGAFVISSSEGRALRQLVGASLPFFVALCGVLAWQGGVRLAWSVGKAVVLYRVPIPVAAFTERELAFRYGLFFLFVLVASWPAVIGTLICWQGAIAAARKAFHIPRPRSGRRWMVAATLRFTIRLFICVGMLALASIA